MTSLQDHARRRRAWSLAAVAALAGVFLLTAPGRGLAHRFIASLRIARPDPVKANAPTAFTGPAANRRIVEALGGMIATKVDVTLDEGDQPVANVQAADKVAGFAAHLPRARTDSASLAVTGAHALRMTVDRANLLNILAEAGRPNIVVPPSLDGAAAAVSVPRGIRAQYGNCPAPVANTIQGQLQSPPPLTAANANCIVLTERPAAASSLPDGLDVPQLVEIALELAGISPNDARTFEDIVDWKSALVLSMPRGMRSHEAVTIGGARGVLVTTAFRRGPTYSLIWVRDGLVFVLDGYGNPGDAVALAASVR